MKKETFVTKDQLDEIIKTYPTPFYLYDERGIRRNMKALKDAFSWNEGYKAVSYTHLTLPTKA